MLASHSRLSTFPSAFVSSALARRVALMLLLKNPLTSLWWPSIRCSSAALSSSSSSLSWCWKAFSASPSWCRSRTWLQTNWVQSGSRSQVELQQEIGFIMLHSLARARGVLGSDLANSNTALSVRTALVPTLAPLATTSALLHMQAAPSVGAQRSQRPPTRSRRTICTAPTPSPLAAWYVLDSHAAPAPAPSQFVSHRHSSAYRAPP